MTAGWEPVAVYEGGTIGGLARATAEDGAALVFAATSVGVYRSTDGGRSWTLPGTGSSVPFAESLAASPGFAHDQTLFVCAGDGLYRSTDGGATWHQVLVGSRMLSVTVSPGDVPDAVVLVGTEADGVLRSADLGRTWAGANAGLMDLTAIAVALSPWFASDHVGFAGTPSGLYRTRNAAQSWRAVETGVVEPAVQCMAVSPNFAEDRLVLAGTEADGLLVSNDAGTTWHTPPTLAGRCVTAVAFSTGYPARRTIAVATELGVAISTDAGETWRTAAAQPGSVLSLIFVAEPRGEALLAGLTGAGVVRSANDGATWAPSNLGLSAGLLSGLVLSPAFARDRTLLGASLDNGVSRSLDGGRTWIESNAGLAQSPVFGLAVSPAFAADRTVFAATATGIHVSRDAGQSWEQASDVSAPVRAVVTCADPSPTVLAALIGGAVYASQDGTRTWRTLGPAFEGAEVAALAVSPAYARDRTIFVATSQRPPGGSADVDVVVWRSTDAGARWQRWLVERVGGVGAFETVVTLAVSPEYPSDEVIFVGLGRRVLKPVRNARERRPGERRPMWRSTTIAQGGVALTALAVSPAYARDQTVFAASSGGVFVSRDGGESYEAWSDGLAQRRIVALAVSPDFRHDRLVYGVSLGGTIWRRYDTPAERMRPAGSEGG